MSRDVIASYLEAEVRCYHCGRSFGLLRRACDGTLGPTTLLTHHGGAPAAMRRLTDLRCASCHGPVYAEPFEVRHEFSIAPVVRGQRRGRPVRWPAA
jgi:hypothetical protein